MRKLSVVLAGICLAGPAIAQTEDDLVRSLARFYAEMEVAEKVAEICPGLFADEAAIDAEEGLLDQKIVSDYGADQEERVAMSPSLARMTLQARTEIVSRFANLEELCVAAGNGGVRFVTPVRPPMAADEVEDENLVEESPAPQPLESF